MIVITGGAGFIGSNLVAALAARGAADLVVCDWLGQGDKWRNLAKHEIADLVEPDDFFTFLDVNEGRIQAVFHLGAITSTTETDADLVMRTNFTLSLALWHWCSERRVRFIYASSAATYGDGSQGFDDDGSAAALSRLRPLNVYGLSKHAFDRRVARIVAAGGPQPPQWAGLKFFNVYGPNEYHKGAMKSVVVQIHADAAAGLPATLFRSHNPEYPDGGQMRDFIWVGDCVEAMLWLFDNRAVSGLFNLGTGKARSFLDLAHAVFRALGKKPAIQFIDTPAEIRDKYQYFTQAQMTRLRAAGYTAPFLSLEEGVERYVRGYLSAADPYR
ncbi:MAG TPA: ADP-glyceromanno-heptose 6-epimerase [Alphaproteobacteria bacterium]|nr:ADP-glyceromanno-heptose 6-epimerase [Alphaproteobacteria bacterium]